MEEIGMLLCIAGMIGVVVFFIYLIVRVHAGLVKVVCEEVAENRDFLREVLMNVHFDEKTDEVESVNLTNIEETEEPSLYAVMEDIEPSYITAKNIMKGAEDDSKKHKRVSRSL